MSTELVLQAQQLLAREALALDNRAWDDWLALFRPDAVFWMPSWKNESELSGDPDSEMSLFYFDSRAQLEDRVWRISKGKSIASTPLLRTVHTTSNVLAVAAGDDAVDVYASWTCHTFNPKRNVSNTFFGRSEYHVVIEQGDWRIRRKKSILMNDYIPTMLDFYCC